MKSKSMIMGSSRKIQYHESNFNIFYDDVLLNDVKYENLLGIKRKSKGPSMFPCGLPYLIFCADDS
jgi:hypothetical protein